ncbi:hypothetical protein [Stackebrandtia albiflava]|uniref:hypothetical protein n=1 Tax=Stackebrandtia albiflava TaxID=406432 RepID=UPI0011BD7041|nr:hypothetical protein [Stackebrandtia albiflava]
MNTAVPVIAGILVLMAAWVFLVSRRESWRNRGGGDGGASTGSAGDGDRPGHEVAADGSSGDGGGGGGE